jgi:hypothetical protein
MKEFSYKRNNDDVFVSVPLDFSDNELRIYHRIITIKGKNGSYHDDQFLLPREKTGIYSRCWCFLEDGYISLKFCSMGYDEKAKPTIEDIEAEYANYMNQLLDMIKEVLRLQETIKLIPEE